VRRACRFPAIILICTLLAPSATQANQSVSLHATLTPERLGQATTVGFAFQITTPTGQVPSPLTAVDVRYPGNLGIALSGLGLATCSPATLEAAGPQGCPADSLMGYGTAIAEIQIGPDIERETAGVTLLRSPTQDGHLALLFYVSAMDPVRAEISFPGLLLPAPSPYGGDINIDIPLVPSLPGASDVAVVKLTSTLGPEHLTYYEHTHGQVVPYNPKGILLPDTCPHDGFPFAAEFAFLDGSHSSAHTTVPCPRHRGRGR
jgi:hypothetical protein